MINEEVNPIIRQIVDYEVAEEVEKQMAIKSAEIEKLAAKQVEKQMAIKDAEHEKEIARLKAALQEALSQLPQ